MKLLSEDDAITELPQELGLRLSSVFMYDRLVFVEGKSDEDIIREWSTVLNLNFSTANVGFVTIGGVRNFAHYATEATVSFLSKRQVRCWFLVDRDEKEAEEVRLMEERLADNATLKVLQKREIENYLINSKVLSVHIQNRLRESGKGDNFEYTSVDKIEEALNKCADDLKGFTIAKRLAKNINSPAYSNLQLSVANDLDVLKEQIRTDLEGRIDLLNSRKSDFDHSFGMVAEEIEGRWKVDKFSLVPGVELLDCLFKSFGLRYARDRDGPKIASLFEENSISADMRDIIREVVS